MRVFFPLLEPLSKHSVDAAVWALWCLLSAEARQRSHRTFSGGHSEQLQHTPGPQHRPIVCSSFPTEPTVCRSTGGHFPQPERFRLLQVPQVNTFKASIGVQDVFAYVVWNVCHRLHLCRYIFKNEKKVGIQELGPRFTLKLRSLQKGTFDSKFGEYEWVLKVSQHFPVVNIYVCVRMYCIYVFWRSR